MGGKPSKATPKDMRLKANNPNAGKPASAVTSAKPTTATGKKGGK